MGIVFDTYGAWRLPYCVLGIVFDTYGAWGLPYCVMGIVFDTYGAWGLPYCVMGIVFDTYVSGRASLLCDGYRFRYLWGVGASLLLLGIVFDTYVSVGASLLCVGYRFRYLHIRGGATCGGFRYRAGIIFNTREGGGGDKQRGCPTSCADTLYF